MKTSTDVMRLADVPIGSVIECEGSWWTVNDIRRHAETHRDTTAWIILDGWGAAGMGDPPRVLLDTLIRVRTSFT